VLNLLNQLKQKKLVYPETIADNEDVFGSQHHASGQKWCTFHGSLSSCDRQVEL